MISQLATHVSWTKFRKTTVSIIIVESSCLRTYIHIHTIPRIRTLMAYLPIRTQFLYIHIQKLIVVCMWAREWFWYVHMYECACPSCIRSNLSLSFSSLSHTYTQFYHRLLAASQIFYTTGIYHQDFRIIEDKNIIPFIESESQTLLIY